MHKLQQPIAILGGTFDPIHNGHVAILNHLSDLNFFDQIRIVPCRQPFFKTAPRANEIARLQMINLAIEEMHRVVIDFTEINREEEFPSYTFDTLTVLHQKFPHSPMCLLLGMDAFNDLPYWHRWTELFDLTHFIVVNRPDIPPHFSPTLQTIVDKRQGFYLSAMTQSIAGQIYFLPLKTPPVSSSMVRKYVMERSPLNNLVPDAVARYIYTHNLYL